MAQPKAPSPWSRNNPLIDPRTGLLTAHGTVFLQQMWRQVAAGFVLVPVVIAGSANALTLTPQLDEEGAASYGDGMAWVGEIAANSTGAVTAAVGSLGSLKVYKSHGLAQAGNGDLLDGEIRVFIYWSTLDSAAGGLVLK